MSFLDDMEQSPPPRRWYRRKLDGQLGYMVEEHGREMIRLDRPGDKAALAPFRENTWDPVSSDRPLNRAQVAKIAYGADVLLCKVIGNHEVRKEWASLSDKERQKWVKDGPAPDPPIRRDLYERIVGLFPGATP